MAPGETGDDPMFNDNTTIDPGNPHTWTVRRDMLPDKTTLVTHYHPVAFRHGHHFETVVFGPHTMIGASHTSATETEARDQHATLAARLRTQMEAA